LLLIVNQTRETHHLAVGVHRKQQRGRAGKDRQPNNSQRQNGYGTKNSNQASSGGPHARVFGEQPPRPRNIGQLHAIFAHISELLERQVSVKGLLRFFLFSHIVLSSQQNAFCLLLNNARTTRWVSFIVMISFPWRSLKLPKRVLLL